MLIKLLSRPIIVDCFTADQTSYDLFKLTPAMRRVPQWWKNTPHTYPTGGIMPSRTLKSCDGIINLYKHGFILPLWSDLAVEIRADGAYRWQFSDMQSHAIVHSPEQWKTYVSESQYGHMKLQSNWRMKTNSSLEWLYTAPTWNYKPDNGWTVAMGVVNYKYSREVNVNIFLGTTKPQTILLPVDTPLVHMIPLTDKKVELRHHMVTVEEFNRQTRPLISFSKFSGVVERISKRQESKCPFGFSK